jgi:transposase-like protein
MNRKKAGVPDTYPPDLKIAIAREYFSSDLSFGDLGKKYGHSRDTVRYFAKWYKNHFPDIVVTEATGDPGPEQHVITPVDKTTAKQLAEANLRIAALEMLIKNASKELGVDIVKKSGTGQSAK